MAEIFAAVASGAGLLSLAIQLFESSRKLKDFYNTSKDAPQAVADLSFELETMSLSLRQLEMHRRADILSDRLLDRCVVTCTRMAAKIEAAVAKMDHLLKRVRGVGMVYTAFKEPQMRKLLEELEHAKSSMLFAYMSYCQSWNMREAANRAADVHLQNAFLSSHQAQLQTLDRAVQTSHAAIIRQLEVSLVQEPTTPPSTALVPATSKKRSVQTNRKRQPSLKLRLAFPRWLTTSVWEFAMHECEGGWNMQLRPINIRPYGSFAFDVVRSGDVKAVMNLLAIGELSVSDHEVDKYGLVDKSPLTIAAEAGHLQLCESLLREFPVCRLDAQIHEALFGFIRDYWYCRARPSLRSGSEDYDNLTEAFYSLFFAKYGLSVELDDCLKDPTIARDSPAHRQVEDVHSSILLTERALQDVIASQPIPFARWSLDRRFRAAVDSQGWPATSFVNLVNFDTTSHLAQYKDTQGRTALHWGAGQLGLWMSHFDTRVSWEKKEDRLEEYSNLCAKLITAGADVHALDSQNRTPFACMILSSPRWIAGPLTVAIRRWGDLLQESGVSLRGFLGHENSLLVRNDDIPIGFSIYDLGRLWTYRLLIVSSTTLAMEVGTSLICPMWEFHPPPGAWSRKSGQIDKIIWRPDSESDGHDWYLWQEADELVVNLAPKLLCETPPLPSLAESISESWEDLLDGGQDDHGFVATAMRRTSTRSGHRKQRRRAASLPPPTTMYGHFRSPAAESTLYSASYRWRGVPHKCPLHLNWKFEYPAKYFSATDHRRCMQGRCDDYDGTDWSGSEDLMDSDHWEARLLKDERNVDIARRFTDRFRPEWRAIVEENHSRAERRAQLDIAVARA